MQQRNRDFLKTEVALQAIRNGNAEAVLDSLYAYILPEFVRRGTRKFRTTQAELVDVFQDVLVAFYLQVSRCPEMKINTPWLKDFLYGIGDNKLATIYQKRKRRFWLENNFYSSMATDPDVVAFSWHQYENPCFDIEVLRQVVNTLSPRCADILIRTLLEQQKIKQVMVEMGYKDENNTSATKSRCLVELKKRLLDRIAPDTIAAWFGHFTQ